MNKLLKILLFTLATIILNILSIYLVEISGILHPFKVGSLPEECKKWNDKNVMEINLVLSGLVLGPLLYMIFCKLKK